MLVQFSVGNFKSIKEPVTFSMVSAPIKDHSDTHIFEAPGKLKLLKSAVIYGANASGKSNIFTAMRFVKKFILESSKDRQAHEKIPVDFFRLSSETENMPSNFEIVFIQKNTRYRYGFEVTQSEVVREWLFNTTRVKNEVMLFERNGQEFNIGKNYKEGQLLQEKTRKNALFLSVVAQFNGKIADEILTWFVNFNILSGLSERLDDDNSNNILENIGGELKDVFLSFLREADLGIEDLSIQKNPFKIESFSPRLQELLKKNPRELPDQTTVKVSHNYFNEKQEMVSLKQFDLQRDESQGTQKLYSLLGPIVVALATSEILVIDELDASFHPLITRFIISLFNCQGNRANAQLIFNTHDTNLLSKKYLRRDQIWFAEKDQYGRTDIYSLAEFNVRNDASFEKDYLLGKYGSIPYIGSFEFECCGDKEN